MSARVNMYRNRRNIPVVNGQVSKTPDDIRDPIEVAAIDTRIEHYLDPHLDVTVKSIERETQELRMLGKLEPFREGTHLGTLPPRTRKPRQKKLDDAHLRNKRAERRRTEMLALRKYNNEILKRIIERGKLYG